MDFKVFIKKLPLKEKYLQLLIEISDNLNEIEKYTKKGKIVIKKYILLSENKLSYKDFIQILEEILKIDELQFLNYIGKIEYMLDKNTKVGVGYRVISNFLQSLENEIKTFESELLKNEVKEKLITLKKVYEKKNKKTVKEMNKFYNFLDYVNAQIYFYDAIDNNRYTFEDIRDIKDIEKEFFKGEIVINLEVFLTYLYKNVLNIEKDENFILETIEKYPGYGIFLLQRIYRKYIDTEFEPEKKLDRQFEHIIVI